MSRRSSNDTFADQSWPNSPRTRYSMSSSSSTAYSPDSFGEASERTSKLPMYLADLEDEKSDGSRRFRACCDLPYLRTRRAKMVAAVLGLVFTGAVYSQFDIASAGGGLIPYGQASDSNVGNEDISSASPFVERPKGPAPTPSTALQKWGLDLDSKVFLASLSPWPDKAPVEEDQPPLSSLGHFADQTYNYGPLVITEYHQHLTEFIDASFPESLKPHLREGLDGYLRSGDESHTRAWDKRKAIWQTDKNDDRVNDRFVTSWRADRVANEGWKWEMVADVKAGNYVSEYLKDSRIEMVWNSLPTGILRADMLRYLLLYLEGGIYSDTDTRIIKTPSNWGRDAILWREGAGWLESALLDRIQAGESVNDVLPPPSVVVGVEADVGEREDWHNWWPRPMQIVQWTMASAPYHPITLEALERITHSTATAVDWAHGHSARIQNLNDMAEYEKSEELLQINVLKDTKNGGPVGIMDWTGPGVWTDAVLSYLRMKYGLVWTDLRGLTTPLRVGDVVILPVTGFSPGVGNFGAKEVYDSQAMVEHLFRGSWKGGQR